MSFDAWIVIMLAGIGLMVALLAIMLTIMAVVVAVAAWWGYGGMMDAVKTQAAVSAKEVSLEHLLSRATIAATKAAKEQAEATILANKDKWLEDMALGLEMPAAQSEASPAASKDQETVVIPNYPGEERPSGSTNQTTNPGTDNPTTPGGTAG